MPWKPIDPDVERRAILMARQGAKPNNIATDCGISAATVYKIFHRNGLDLPAKSAAGRPHAVFSEQQKQRMRSMFQDGESATDIASNLSVTLERVRQFIKDDSFCQHVRDQRDERNAACLEQAIVNYCGGMQIQTAADLAGISVASLYRTLRDRGLVRNRRS